MQTVFCMHLQEFSRSMVESHAPAELWLSTMTDMQPNTQHLSLLVDMMVQSTLEPDVILVARGAASCVHPKS